MPSPKVRCILLMSSSVSNSGVRAGAESVNKCKLLLLLLLDDDDVEGNCEPVAVDVDWAFVGASAGSRGLIYTSSALL